MGTQQPADFSFPSLEPPRPRPGGHTDPFSFQQQPPAAAAVQQLPVQVQLREPVKQATEPLTARSTVVHASSRAADHQLRQQPNDRRPQAAPEVRPKPVPVTQVQAEGRRNKVPLEKGFSQVSWLKLTRSGADLTGGQGGRRDITLEEVRQHRTADDAWMVLHGKVYNITPYLRYHPGGADILMKAAGKDGTSLFNKFHPWVNAHALLEQCLIGLLLKDGEQQADGQPAQETLKSKLSKLFK